MYQLKELVKFDRMGSLIEWEVWSKCFGRRKLNCLPANFISFAMSLHVIIKLLFSYIKNWCNIISGTTLRFYHIGTLSQPTYTFGFFASGFASQSLPLTWGTGPRWLRIFCLFLPIASRFVKINRKSSLVLLKLGS